MDFEAYIRKLSRSPYWQNLYRASKECSGINLFKNTYNHSAVQSKMLYWLSIYDMLYTELSKQEWPFLSDAVIIHDIRCDAFLRLMTLSSGWSNSPKARRSRTTD